MTSSFRFYIPFSARPKARPRFVHGRTWSPSKAEEERITAIAREKFGKRKPFAGPVRLQLEILELGTWVIVTELPRASTRPKGVRGDLTNLAKLIEDAMNPRKVRVGKRVITTWPGVYNDDRQIERLEVGF